MKALQKLLAATLALSLPLAGIAQDAPKPEDTVKVTPYGFILANAFMTGNNLQVNDYPGRADAASEGGAVLYSARQSRIGFKLATKDAWSGADINGTVEFDFNGGHLATNNAGFYNGIMRLRVASITSSWNTGAGTISVLAGQDVGIVNTLFAESLAWVASPLFWQAGNLWRRAPQIRLTYGNKIGDTAISVAVAALNPATADGSVDFGSGTQSRKPNFEGRLGISTKVAGDFSGALGIGFHTNTRRLAYGTANQQDVKGSMFGLDLDLGLTKYLQVKGEFYSGKGSDDTYNAIGSATVIAAPNAEGVKSAGLWAQAIVKPTPWLWVTLGTGAAAVDQDQLEANVAAGSRATTRVTNSQAAAGLLVNAGKFWRFGLEYCQVRTEYLNGPTVNGPLVEQKATQLALSSQLKF